MCFFSLQQCSSPNQTANSNNEIPKNWTWTYSEFIHIRAKWALCNKILCDDLDIRRGKKRVQNNWHSTRNSHAISVWDLKLKREKNGSKLDIRDGESGGCQC